MGGRTISKGLHTGVDARNEPVRDLGDDVDEADVLVFGVLLQALGFGVGGEVYPTSASFPLLFSFSLSFHPSRFLPLSIHLPREQQCRHDGRETRTDAGVRR